MTGAALGPAIGGHPTAVLAAAAIFLLTYVVLGLGALPPLRLDRAGATLVGATPMIVCGAPITLLTLAWGAWWLR